MPWAEAKLPLEDRGLQFAESLYEVLPVTAGVPRLLAEHHARIRQGARLLGLERGLPDPDLWSRIAHELVRREGIAEGLFYAQLTGGSVPRDHLPGEPPRPCCFAYARARRFPRAADAERGARVVVLPDTRWQNCHLKTTMLLPAVLARREAALRGADEALLCGPRGNLREGTSSNLFLVEGSRIVTPRATTHVLPGITGPLVRGLAEEAGCGFEECDLPLRRAQEADEVFLTSTSRLVMPVVELDGKPVAGGKAGPRAKDLARRLRQRLHLD